MNTYTAGPIDLEALAEHEERREYFTEAELKAITEGVAP